VPARLIVVIFVDKEEALILETKRSSLEARGEVDGVPDEIVNLP
jgi:hypothetical protein